ncbi:MAG TPA: tRNA dihydrouridine synthase DusB [Myxococcota bacterium]
MFHIGKHLIDPPYLLAPMASVSEMPFRVLALELGAGLATTELVSSAGIFYKNRRTRQYMTFDRDKERPYSLQLFGGDPKVMAHAARAAYEHGADIVDINMGCPVKKVTTTGSGSALLCDLPRAAEMIRAMRAAVDDAIPITAKIRAGWDDKSINAVEMAKELEGAGCAALALHARTRAQAYSGKADWDLIGRVKAAVKMPIIGNGDVCTVDDALRMRSHTGCDAVMIGRGALGNPWIFSALKQGHKHGPTKLERLTLIRRHLREHIAFHESLQADEDKPLRTAPTLMATKTFRQHLVWYSRGLRGGKDFRKEVLTLEDPALVVEKLERFFSEADAEMNDVGAAEPEGVAYHAAFG